VVDTTTLFLKRILTMSATAQTDSTPNSSNHETHVSPTALCITFGLLMILLVATVISAKVFHGTAGTVTGLSISVVKTFLIAVIFMNLKGSVGMIRLAACAAILWLAIAVMIVMGDYATRSWDEVDGLNLRQATIPAGTPEAEAP